MTAVQRSLILLSTVLGLSACDDPVQPRDDFLGGVEGNRQIGLVLDSAGAALELFKLGAPNETARIPLGSGPGTVANGFAVRNDTALVALGNPASVALVELEQVGSGAAAVVKRFAFPAGGSANSVAFVDDTSAIAVNSETGEVGRFSFGETGIRQTVRVVGSPRKVLVSLDRAYVLSATGSGGVITILDPYTLEPLGSVPTGGIDPRDLALASADRLYVVHAGDADTPGSLGVVAPLTPALLETIPGFGTAPDRIHIDPRGLAYISSPVYGTVIWDTREREFFRGRGPDNPLCADPCRGATDARPNEQGDVYQTSAAGPDPARVYVWDRQDENAQGYSLIEPIMLAGMYPIAVQIRRFAP